jgi:hypothetical protein
MYPSISEMIGHTFCTVEADNDTLTFVKDDGTRYRFLHRQDCCESVYIESIVGDLSDLVGTPLLNAEEVSSGGTPALCRSDEEYGSYTWTFYKFATIKGYVDVRFYGSSNGYYGEGVDMEKDSI